MTPRSSLLLMPFKGKQAEGILLTATLSSAPTQCHLQKGLYARKCTCVCVYVCVSSPSGVTLKVMRAQLLSCDFSPLLHLLEYHAGAIFHLTRERDLRRSFVVHFVSRYWCESRGCGGEELQTTTGSNRKRQQKKEKKNAHI